MNSLFDLATGKVLRDYGIAKASSWPASEWVERAREYAVGYAIRFGEVSIDDVLKAHPRPEDVNPNATGAVMKDKHLEPVGFKLSEKKTAHARAIRIYRYKP